MPTDVPVTEEPVATESPTAEPTATEVPTPTPTPTPTPRPAVPFDPTVTCALIEGGSLAIAGETDWSIQECTATWSTENVSEVTAVASSDTTGWNLIVVNADDLQSADVLNQSDAELALTDSTAEDDGFLTSRFYIGTQLGCTSPLDAAIKLDLTATSTAPVSEDENGNPLPIVAEDGTESPAAPGATNIETDRTDLVLSGHAATAPTVTLNSVTFTGIANSLDSSSVSQGTVSLTVANASAACGWQTTISFGDFTSGNNAIPASNLSATGLSGLEGVHYTSDGGVITLVVPAGVNTRPSDAEVVVSLELNLGSFVPQGTYGTTVVFETIANP